MQLSEICEINPRTILVDESIDVSFVGMQDVSEDGAIYTGNVRPYQEVKKGYTAFEEGDVLFAKITPCMENGKGAVAKGLLNGKGAGSTEFHILRPICDRVNSDWLYYLTSFTGFRQSAERSMTGSAGQKRVPKTFLEKYKVDVPDISTQEHQVQSLNFLRDIIHQREQQIKVCDELIKARFVELFGDPEFNSMGWESEQLGNVCKVGSSKRIYQNEQSPEGIPFLRISDLVNRMDTGEMTCDLYIPESRFEELLGQELVPIAGDILLTARGTLGRCYIVKPEDRFYFQDGMISWLYDFSDSVTALYISYLFDMPGFRKQIDGMQAGSTVAYLSISMTKKLVVMLPPIKLQEQFADFVEQVDKSKAEVQKALEKTQLLFDSLMQEYFG